ncbi:MAG TPA: hypothetical protein VF062_23680 [Candidatus Limnocylindrales bacterium]
MNTPHEPDLRAAMRELSDVAGPGEHVADAALRGAKGMRRRRSALTGVAALAAVAALSVPFTILNNPPGGPPENASPGFAAPAPNLGACQGAPMVSPGIKEVAEEHWPQYLKTVLGLLPKRDDYVVQNTHDICNTGHPQAPNAYTVINLGHNREHGHLTVDLYVHENVDWVPDTCADLDIVAASSQLDVVFCQDGKDGKPLLYGTAYPTTKLTVGAVYPDRRAVVMERNLDEGADAVISVDDLKAVVSNQDLLGLVPVSSVPLPTVSPASQPGGLIPAQAPTPNPTSTPTPTR